MNEYSGPNLGVLCHLHEDQMLYHVYGVVVWRGLCCAWHCIVCFMKMSCVYKSTFHVYNSVYHMYNSLCHLYKSVCHLYICTSTLPIRHAAGIHLNRHTEPWVTVETIPDVFRPCCICHDWRRSRGWIVIHEDIATLPVESSSPTYLSHFFCPTSRIPGLSVKVLVACSSECWICNTVDCLSASCICYSRCDILSCRQLAFLSPMLWDVDDEVMWSVCVRGTCISPGETVWVGV